MTTVTTGKLLVDQDTGRVLRADDSVVLSRRNAEFHPFIEILETWDGDFVFAGPEAGRRAGARKRREGEAGMDAIEYDITSEVDGELQLVKVEG